MPRIFPLLAALTAALALSGCETMTDTQRRTTAGIAVGALAGAGIAKATGGKAGVGAVAGAVVGGVGTYIWSQNMERQKRELEASMRGHDVTISRTPHNQLKIAIPSDISFDSNSAYIKSSFRPMLNQLASSLRAYPNTQAVIIGHTDNTGGPHINNPLSLNRANSARNHLVGQGVSGHRMQTEGRGAREPIANNSSTWGRGKNRRVEIYVTEYR